MITALIAGLALSITALLGYRSTGELFDVAGTGQAESLLRSLRREAANAKPTDAFLAEFINENDDLGLRYIAFIDLSGKVVAQAGKSIGNDIPFPEDPVGRELQLIGDRVRYSSLIRPRVSRRMMDGGMMDRISRRFPLWTGPLDFDRSLGPWRLVLEFEPVLLKQLKFRSTLTLIGALAASGLLVASAILFWRLTRKALEAEIEMEEQRRLASLGEMTAVLAHEIKNPLAALKGHAQLLEERLPPEGPERKKAGLVVGEAVRLQVLVNELLDFVRSNKLSIALENPLSVLSEAAQSIDTEKFEISGSPTMKPWPMDRVRIVQALANILQNGIQASPEGAKVRAAVREDGNSLVFEISDQGRGIAPEDMSKIFEPFHTGRVRGVGLGLAVVKKIVEAHQGTVTAANNSEGGATFTISLPNKGDPFNG